jgi:hypothetical protein
MEFELLIEKNDGNGWRLQLIKLDGKSLHCFEGQKLQDSIDLAGSTCVEVQTVGPVDEKILFSFAVVRKNKERILFNALCERERSLCLDVFNEVAGNENFTFDKFKEEILVAASGFSDRREDSPEAAILLWVL